MSCSPGPRLPSSILYKKGKFNKDVCDRVRGSAPDLKYRGGTDRSAGEVERRKRPGDEEEDEFGESTTTEKEAGDKDEDEFGERTTSEEETGLGNRQHQRGHRLKKTERETNMKKPATFQEEHGPARALDGVEETSPHRSYLCAERFVEQCGIPAHPWRFKGLQPGYCRNDFLYHNRVIKSFRLVLHEIQDLGSRR
ncbi:hypothetical protein NDU88_011979 [Pleurodeles waltl]|uniref:Uncharacterized protein n=1 Tax=Pleurodeles waltl TaxID=8319 RepID=A0AAV7QYW8_PLEWA|nr:hypothetical protein NDU88_011979 [Pleurodeles waltl]